MEVAVAESKEGDLEQGEEEAMKAMLPAPAFCQVEQLPRQHGEAETPTSN